MVWDAIYMWSRDALERAAFVFAAVSGSVLLLHTIMSRCKCRNSKKQQQLYSHTRLLYESWINGDCGRRRTLHLRQTPRYTCLLGRQGTWDKRPELLFERRLLGPRSAHEP